MLLWLCWSESLAPQLGQSVVDRMDKLCDEALGIEPAEDNEPDEG
jgi:hypothetical protein